MAARGVADLDDTAVAVGVAHKVELAVERLVPGQDHRLHRRVAVAIGEMRSVLQPVSLGTAC